ncbi:CD63 antigen-like [Onthophagus taurus]|uniref:CD63 antigen-like n=1 Tax=Onthophagus taurus TaxID=166361 RepID=UPI000C20734F|nr:tetraspanin-9-like [Onthophagus taurus]XP_022918279.1 tetraspanin-9-like [Onthophagus taurus]XP_022918280.1 tetraspanin-9-like [Onthophagus taurus]
MGCATKCVAWFVFIFNIILACLGIAILTVGILFQLNVINYIIPVTDVKESLDYLPIIIIVIGSLIFLTGILGCISAGRGNTKLLWTYVVVLILIFAIQICLGVFIMFQVHCETDIQNRINSHLLEGINNYNGNNTVIKTRIDALQRRFDCCGIESPNDWNTDGSGVLPPSCCENNEKCGINSDDIFTRGCGPLILDNFNNVVRITYILAFAVAAQQFMGVIFAFILITSIRNEERRSNYR